MKAVSRVISWCLVLLLSGVLLAAATPIAASAPIDPDRLPLSYRGWDWRLTRQLGYWWERLPRGSWSVERGRLRSDGRLELVVSIQPPEVPLPLDPGPATLFGSLDLGGDGGSVGVEVQVGRPIHVQAQRCAKRKACELRARIVLPAQRLFQAAARARNAVSWWALDVNLVLVRTFAQGSWLQVLPLEGRAMEGSAGTVTSPGSFTAKNRTFGLFTRRQARRWLRDEPATQPGLVRTVTIAERARVKGTDRSSVPATVPVDLELDAGDCEGWSLMTRTGDVAFDETERLLGPEAHTILVPEGTTWYLRSPSLENIDVPRDTIHTFGPFAVGGKGLALSGAWSCDEPSGSVTAVEGPTVAARLGPTSSMCDDSPNPAVRPDLEATAETSERQLPGAWEDIAPAPIKGRFGHTATWTGNEVIVWGGATPDEDTGEPTMPSDGAAYDPATDTWRRIREAPIEGREGHTAVWTGSELIVWGGRRADRVLRDGAAYDPVADRWRPISKLDRGYGRYSHDAVWTGDDMIVWSGVGRDGNRRWRNGESLGYDPVADDWEELRSPLMRDRKPEAVVAAGDLLLTVGYGNKARAKVMAYDPARDQWSRLPRVPLSGSSHAAPIWTGTELLLVTVTAKPESADLPVNAAYRPAGSCWWTPSVAPSVSSTVFEPVWGEGLLLFAGPMGVAYQPSSDSWFSMPTYGSLDREQAAAVWIGDRLFIWGGRTVNGGDVLGDGATFTPDE